MKQAIKQGIIVVFDFGLMSLANFVVTILLAKSVIPEEYSLYVLATSLLMLLLSVHKALVATPYTVIAPKLQKFAKRRFQGIGLLITAIMVVLSLLALFTYISVTDGQYEKNSHFSLLLSLFCAWSFFYMLREHMRSVMLAELKVKAGFLANITGSVLILAALAYWYLKLELTLQTLLYSLIVSTLIPSILMLALQNRHVALSSRNFIVYLNKYWSIAKWNLVNAVLYSGANLSIPWLILWFSDKKSVAVYGICLAFASVANPLLRGVNGYLFPKMSHGYNRTGIEGLWRLTRLSIFVMLIPFSIWLGVVVLFGDELLRLFYSEEYGGYQWILTLIVLKMTIETVSAPINSSLQTIEKPYVITAALIIGLIMTATLGIKLIQNYGLWGAAILGVLNSGSMMLIKWITLKRAIKHSRPFVGIIDPENSELEPS